MAVSRPLTYLGTRTVVSGVLECNTNWRAGASQLTYTPGGIFLLTLAAHAVQYRIMRIILVGRLPM